MKKFKTQKGITLVALVITIIVLLILAVVAIGAVRDSGVIGHAQNSADRYNAGKVEEESMLGQYEDAISQYETGTNFGTSGEGNAEINKDEEEGENNADETGVKYYASDKFSGLYKIDWKNNTLYEYYRINEDELNDYEDNEFEFTRGEPTIADIKIKVKVGAQMIETVVKKGAKTYYIGDIIVGYLYNNELYTVNLDAQDKFFLTELVTDEAEIAKIEAAIANIK